MNKFKLAMLLLTMMPLVGGCIYTVGNRPRSDQSKPQEFRDPNDPPPDITPASDTTPPTIAISSKSSSLTVGETSLINFQLLENSSDFTVTDVNVDGGYLSSFNGYGSQYTAIFSPASTGVTAKASITIPNDAFSDTAGNFNQDGHEANNAKLIAVVPQDYECDGFMHSGFMHSSVPIKIIVHGGMQEGESMTWRWAERESESEPYTMGPPTHHNFGHKNAEGQLVQRKNDVVLSYYWHGPGSIDLEKCEFVWDVEQAQWENLLKLLPILDLW